MCLSLAAVLASIALLDELSQVVRCHDRLVFASSQQLSQAKHSSHELSWPAKELIFIAVLSVRF